MDEEAPGSGPSIDMVGVVSALELANQNMSKLITTISSAFPAESATASRLSITNSTAGGTTAKVGSGWLMAVSVNVPSTTGGTIYDANSPANVSSTNIMMLIPSSGIVTGCLPFLNGLTVQPSSVSTHTVSVFYI